MKYKINGIFNKKKRQIKNHTDEEIKGGRGACVSENNYKENSIMDYCEMYRRSY
ncbi:hypothetical protein [Lysinibacillus sp. Bpr_S20]|uniref:hypothetical protein n=1 Tax=Lysinibacillus sp. Bpr_S20 TaxID=2933964 RepID=UPI0020114B77|nr:hypothetical protein [Lysinibacillus sp. Bpr_S20]MCL1699494.1 hypothetical protein [Lysinibacillus sp. Bpr_S20]